jgi:hypothetical protein
MLIEKELIEEAAGRVAFADPACKKWFQRHLT